MTTIFAALEATWPAAAKRQAGGWTVRQGQGGGKRVSCATAEDDAAAAQIDLAEASFAEFDQPALFCIRGDQHPLDRALDARGYQVADPVILFAAPVADLAAEPPEKLTTFPIWPPLAITAEIWAAGGIGPERRAVMERAALPKTAILGRTEDRAAGAAFVSMFGGVAVLHALHVDPQMRRKGLARNLMRGASHWAAQAGAKRLALAVTAANAPAIALYKSFGMAEAGNYHYRVR